MSFMHAWHNIMLQCKRAVKWVCVCVYVHARVRVRVCLMMKKYVGFIQLTCCVLTLAGLVMEQRFCPVKNWNSCMAANGTGSILRLSLIQ